MEIIENKSSLAPRENKDSITGNYQQPQTDGTAQTVLVDPAITAETDELDPIFQHGPFEDDEDPEDPENDEEDDDFPLEEDLDEDFDLDQDTNESDLDTDDDDDFEL